ncbi:MAG TPA: hypothetical protein VHM94_07335 [Acidimicrobiia bacterium]|jgi:hypothetical protein|nr:hypothetical protein [Acidimicrobiia bacterium]
MLEVRSIETTMLEEDGSRAEAGYVETGRGAVFAVTHIPPGPAKAAVLICSPIQSELLKNNRREVMLARRLARRGLAVSRFHYIGTGNSDGDIGDVTIDGMAADTAAVASALTDVSGTDRIGFVATRLGSLPASTVASGLPGSPLALWEPVVSGRSYLRELMRVWLMVGMRQGNDEAPSVADEIADQLARTGSFAIMGFSIGGALKEDLERSDLKVEHPADHDVLLVQFGQRAGIRRELRALAADLEERGGAPTIEQVRFDEAWWLHVDVDALTPDIELAMNTDVVDRTERWLRGVLGVEDV